MEETKAILGEIDFDNHRASVIVAAGGVNGMLRRVLDSFLNEPDTNQDKLLDGRGALSTFGSRIRLCNRLGLIDDEVTKVIDLLRRTRNVFAHEVSAGDLTEQQHAERLEEIYAPIEGSGFEKTVASDKTLSPARKLSLSVAACIAVLKFAERKIDAGKTFEDPIGLETIAPIHIADELLENPSAEDVTLNPNTKKMSLEPLD